MLRPSTLPATLPHMPWSELLGYAVAAFALSQFVVLLGPDWLKGPLHRAAPALVLCLIAAKDLAHLPDARRRLRDLRGQGGAWWRYIAALLPPELVGMVRLDGQMWAGARNRVLRRKAPIAPTGTPVTYLERGGYGAASAIVLVSVFVELPLHAGIVSLFVKEPSTLAILHACAALAALYTLVWVLGDRWHVGAGQHIIDDDTLHLRVGARTCGSVPLAAIERIEAVDQTVAVWRHRHGVSSRDTVLVTPFDRPNCLIVMKREADVTILHWQVTRCLPRYVFLYVDRPALLIERCVGRQHG